MTDSTNYLNKIEPRVSSLETEVRSLERSVESLANTTRESHQVLSSQISKLTEAVSRGRETSWGTIASFAGLLLAIVASIGALAINPLKVGLKETDNVYQKDLIPGIHSVENKSNLNSQAIQFHSDLNKLGIEDLNRRIIALEDFKVSTSKTRFSYENYKELVLPRINELQASVNEHQSDGHPDSVIDLMQKLEQNIDNQLKDVFRQLGVNSAKL